MKKFLAFLITVLSYWNMNAAGIIVLNGTSTSGKSTLARALQESYGDVVEIVSIDSFFTNNLLWRYGFSYLNPFEWTKTNEEIFSPKEIKEISKKSHMELCNKAYELYHSGKSVIIDVVVCDQEIRDLYDQLLQETNISWFLVYCPLGKLIERVVKRNESTDDKEKRSLAQVLHQFSKMYKKNDEESEAFSAINVEDDYAVLDVVVEMHNSMHSAASNLVKAVQLGICPDTIESIKEVLNDTFFSNDNLSENSSISHIFKYDYLIDTSKDLDIQAILSDISKKLLSWR